MTDIITNQICLSLSNNDSGHNDVSFVMIALTKQPPIRNRTNRHTFELYIYKDKVGDMGTLKDIMRQKYKRTFIRMQKNVKYRNAGVLTKATV